MLNFTIKLPGLRYLYLILFAGLCSGIYAQFPAPTSFQFSYDYILLGESGMCDDVQITGPAYCSRFNWSAPDTSQTDATLEYYWIYLDDFQFQSVTDTFYTRTGGYIGKFYVTAVYSNPEGESDSSNNVYNYDLPIAVKEIQTGGNYGVMYDRVNNQLVIKDSENIKSVRIFDILGHEIYNSTAVPPAIEIGDIGSGLLLIETITTDNRIKRQKILIEQGL